MDTFEHFFLFCFLCAVFISFNCSLLYRSESPKNLPQDSQLLANWKQKEKIVSLTSNNLVSLLKTDLDKFYERVSQEPLLEQKLELMIQQNNLSEQMINLGRSLGYTFTASEVENSMQTYTPLGQTQYLCLPIGCWQKA